MNIRELHVKETGGRVELLAAALRRLADEHGKQARGASFEHHARAETTLIEAAVMLEAFFEAGVELMDGAAAAERVGYEQAIKDVLALLTERMEPPTHNWNGLMDPDEAAEHGAYRAACEVAEEVGKLGKGEESGR